MDFNLGQPEQVQYTTYNMANLAVIATPSLPRFLLGHNGIVLRRDVEGTDLTEAEKAECESRLEQALCQP
jgi:hypothetical protein